MTTTTPSAVVGTAEGHLYGLTLNLCGLDINLQDVMVTTNSSFLILILPHSCCLSSYSTPKFDGK